MRHLHLRQIVVPVFALTLLLAACGGGEEGATGGAEPADGTGTAAAGGGEVPVLEPGVLSVCTDSPYRPFEFEEGGEFTGFDVDVMNAIAEELGLETEYRVTPFEGIQSGAALAANQCDIAASAMTITEQRAENLNFTEPYFDADQSLLVTAESGASTLDDLSGATIGVQASTTGAAYAQENAPEDAEIVEYPDAATLFTAMQSGEADAALQDFPVNGYFATQNDEYEVIEQYPTGEQYGFATSLENTALVEQVNAALATIREDGTYDDIYTEWFGAAPSESGATPSASPS